MPVTQGDWVVKDIDSIDVKTRQIWFRATGMNKNEDPYHVHYYRVGFDGKNILDLTPDPGTHQVVYSPDKNITSIPIHRSIFPPCC